MTLLKEICLRSLMPTNERNELIDQIDHITNKQNPLNCNEVNEMEEDQREIDDNIKYYDSVVYDYCLNDIGKEEKMRNTSQRNDIELGYSGLTKLNHQIGKRVRYEHQERSK